MTPKQAEEPWMYGGKEKLLAFVREMIGTNTGRHHDEQPLPPGPWDAVIRVAAGRLARVRSPASRRIGDEVMLNPQPLPPRYAFLSAVAEAVVNRAELLQDVADATRQDGTQQGIIIVGGYTSRFADEWCGNGFKLKWPLPGPPPHWFADRLHAIDLVVIGAQLDQASQEAFNPELRQHLANASARFVEAGMSKRF